MSYGLPRVLAVLIPVVCTLPLHSHAQEVDDLRAKTQNPVGNLISVPIETSFDFGADNGTAIVSNLQPVIPFTIGDWNLINRTIAPIAYVEGEIQGTPSIPQSSGSGEAFGLGDINHTAFLSPANPDQVIWGVGPSITFPTATSDELGSGKWSAGPSVVLLTQPAPWNLGILVRQLWSFAGESDRADVSQMLMQPFINYNLDDGWYLTTQPIVTANWKADDKWTVPLGGGGGKLFKIGNQPMNTRLQAYYNVVRPDEAPDWALIWTLQFIFPK